MVPFSLPICLLIFLPLLITPGRMARTRHSYGGPPTWTPSAGCITNLTATIPGYNPHHFSSSRYNIHTTATVHEILKHCPDLESLRLRITLCGCSSWPDRWSLPLTLAGGETYASLKRLSLEGYDFDQSEWEDARPSEPWWDFGAWSWWVQSGRAARWWEYRKLPIEQRQKTNLDLWLDAMDFAHLESLELRLGRNMELESFKEKVTSRLEGLKELVLHSRPDCGQTEAWIKKLKPLTSLTWINGFNTNVLDPLLSHHGKTLERLELRFQEHLGALRPTFSTMQLEQIGEMAPWLKTLNVDVNRNGTWPTEELEAIANISSLERAEVWFEYASELAQEEYSRGEQEYEMEYGHQNDDLLFQKPLLNKNAAEILWAIMKKKAGERLKEVVFYAGDWTRPWDGPLYSRNWLEQKKERWICSEEGCVEKLEDFEYDDDEEEGEKSEAEIRTDDEEAEGQLRALQEGIEL